MAVELMEWHWRDTMRPARFIIFDARSALMVVLVLIHPRPYTLFAFAVTLVLFYFLERLGLTFEAALRKLRASMCGPERPAFIWTQRRRMTDFGGN